MGFCEIGDGDCGIAASGDGLFFTSPGVGRTEGLQHRPDKTAWTRSPHGSSDSTAKFHLSLFV